MILKSIKLKASTKAAISSSSCPAVSLIADHLILCQ